MANKTRQRYAYLTGRVRRQIRKLQEKMPESISLERYPLRDFRPLKELGKVSERELEAGIQYAERVLETGELSLRSRKRAMGAAIKTMNELGYDYINRENFRYFYDFLEDARSRGLGAIYGSKQLIHAFNNAKKRGLTDEEIKGNIEYWAEKYEKQIAEAERKGTPASELVATKRLYVKSGRKASSDTFQTGKKRKK